MIKTLLAAITATVLLASSAVPSCAQYRYRGSYGYGGGWYGGGWNGGAGAALGLGLGLGLLGGALATAPYYAAPYYARPPHPTASRQRAHSQGRPFISGGSTDLSVAFCPKPSSRRLIVGGVGRSLCDGAGRLRTEVQVAGEVGSGD